MTAASNAKTHVTSANLIRLIILNLATSERFVTEKCFNVRSLAYAKAGHTHRICSIIPLTPV